MDLKIIALMAAVVAAIAVGVRAARAAADVRAPQVDAQGSTPPDEGPVVVPAPSEKALRYYRGGNVIWLVEQFLGLAIPSLFLFAGFSAMLRTFASSLARGRFYPTLIIYLCAFVIIRAASFHHIDTMLYHLPGVGYLVNTFLELGGNVIIGYAAWNAAQEPTSSTVYQAHESKVRIR